MTACSACPAVAVTICFVVIWFGVAGTPPVAHRHAWTCKGFWLVTLAIGLVMGGLILVRLQGPGSLLAVAGARARRCSRSGRSRASSSAIEEPLIDVRLLATPAQWPVQLTAFLFGMSVLGRPDPAVDVRAHRPRGGGLRARRLGGLRVHADRRLRALPGDRRPAAPGGRPAHRHARRDARAPACWSRSATGCSSRCTTRPARPSLNMAIAGIGSGALVAALPAAAAAAAPADRTGFVTGMTNTTKTIGGAIASSIFAIALSSTGSIADVEGGPRTPLRLPHGVGGLLDHGPGRGGQPVRRTQGRVHRLTFPDLTDLSPGTRTGP